MAKKKKSPPASEIVVAPSASTSTIMRIAPVIISFLVLACLVFFYPFSQTDSIEKQKGPIKPLPSATPIVRSQIELQEPADIPLKTTSQPAPLISAQGAMVIDLDSGSVLFEHQPDRQLLPASTTKIMTSLVALEVYDLDQIITVDREERTIGQTMNLVKGEQIRVRDLLYGALVSSGNDAALALAFAYPNGSYSGFVRAMNTKAEELGLSNTSYKNVSGIESLGHVTSARDLGILTKEALNNPLFKEMIQTKYKTVTNVEGTIRHPLQSTNQLLGIVPGLYGVKTGWTENARECLVTATTRNGHDIITVILGSEDRFGESRALIEWAYANHSWQAVERERK